MPILTASEFAQKTFDYVVVGGGTAGLVVAARLTEDPNVTVGVIEAGAFYTPADVPTLRIPGISGAAHMDSRLVWGYFSTPQAAADNVRITQARGKVLGGSSAVNFLVTGRGSSDDYDAFEKLGNSGWNWKEFVKYFKKSETFHPPPTSFTSKYNVKPDPEYHGTDGPLHNMYPVYVWDELRTPFIDSLKGLGVENNEDPGTGNNVGTGFSTASIDPETLTRSYSVTAYYNPNAHRPNLSILTNAVASKILFSTVGSSEEVQATGVEFIDTSNVNDESVEKLEGKGADGKYVVTVRREVLLAAGATKTPQILELSGIGNKKILDKFGIKQVVDSPFVGENLRIVSVSTGHVARDAEYDVLKDHLFVTSSFEVLPEIPTTDIMAIPELAKKEFEEYNRKKTGQLTSIHSGFAFLPVNKFVSEEDIKKLERIVENERDSFYNGDFGEGRKKQYELLKEWFGNEKHAWTEIMQRPHMRPGAGPPPVPGHKYMTFVTCNTHPFSRGSIHIRSSNPLEEPDIDPRYLSSEIDLEIIARAVRFSRIITEQKEMKKIVLKSVKPGDEVDTSVESGLDGWKAFCRKTMAPVFHPVGSTSMMPKEAGGVVDSKLKVYGTKNVRVIDAGVIPIQVSHHTQATIYALAEKAADIIKDSSY